MNKQLEYSCLKNISFDRSAEQIGANQAYHERGVGGNAPSRWAIFVIFQQKNFHFCAIWMTFLTIVEPFESTKLLNLKIMRKNKLSSLFSLTLLTGGVRNIFKRFYLWVNFLNEMAKGKRTNAPSATMDVPLSKKIIITNFIWCSLQQQLNFNSFLLKSK